MFLKLSKFKIGDFSFQNSPASTELESTHLKIALHYTVSYKVQDAKMNRIAVTSWPRKLYPRIKIFLEAFFSKNNISEEIYNYKSKELFYIGTQLPPNRDTKVNWSGAANKFK